MHRIVLSDRVDVLESGRRNQTLEFEKENWVIRENYRAKLQTDAKKSKLLIADYKKDDYYLFRIIVQCSAATFNISSDNLPSLIHQEIPFYWPIATC